MAALKQEWELKYQSKQQQLVDMGQQHAHQMA